MAQVAVAAMALTAEAYDSHGLEHELAQYPRLSFRFVPLGRENFSMPTRGTKGAAAPVQR